MGDRDTGRVTRDLDAKETAAWLRLAKAASTPGLERVVWQWGIESYPLVIALAGTLEVGFCTAGPNGGHGLAFSYAEDTALGIYGHRLVGTKVRDRIPPGDARDRHDRKSAHPSATYLTVEWPPVIHEEDVLRLDGGIVRCRFIVKKFEEAPDGTRFAQFIWRAADGK